MLYFNGQDSLIEIKKTYRKLCTIHHPDKGGDTGIMQEINAQYHEALQNIDGTTSENKEGQGFTYH